MKVLVTMVGTILALGGCAGKHEQLAKCSADESPVPALGYRQDPQPAPLGPAFDAVLPHHCGPMRPVSHF
ncbi:hypothetical protein N7E02_03945 (plasmid) [Aliirhizobium terrae]|uniref:hypothetical protein n=1 Tax=Terrirhizobium terrae TaxID=2926709 RepID=UPI002576C28C|nr:hypothetical protein [Rhizobium sp. CC-CFT758]WJH38569.1 hypothetical protein N7E02_03945 [Rhizobium sp. CC-CFT758]